jgi:WD40 repeat protein
MGAASDLKASLWTISDSATCVATRDISKNSPVSGGGINVLALSRDGLHLAVAADSTVEIWRLPTLDGSSIRQEESGMLFCYAEFNFAGDKFLTVSRRYKCVVHVWTTESGVCEGSFKVPWMLKARFLDNNEILCLIEQFDGVSGSVGAMTLSISTGECSRRAAVGATTGNGITWEYIESNHAVIVAYKTTSGAEMIARWNLFNDAFEWQLTGCSDFKRFSCCPSVSFDGTRVAVCVEQLSGLTIDTLCTSSGNCLGTFNFAVNFNIFSIRFLPDDHDAVVFSCSQTKADGTSEVTLLSAYNILTDKCLWEMEVDCRAFAVQHPAYTVLM